MTMDKFAHDVNDAVMTGHDQLCYEHILGDRPSKDCLWKVSARSTDMAHRSIRRQQQTCAMNCCMRRTLLDECMFTCLGSFDGFDILADMVGSSCMPPHEPCSSVWVCCMSNQSRALPSLPQILSTQIRLACPGDERRWFKA
jgi:hypothetical protein